MFRIQRVFEEVVLPRLMRITTFEEALTGEEQIVKDAFLKTLLIRERRTKEPVIVGIINLPDSGGGFVAEQLAKRIGATVINDDAICAMLCKQGQHYELARTTSQTISEDLSMEVVKEHGGNVIMVGDFASSWKRASIREKAQKAGVRLVFIRTYCSTTESGKSRCEVAANIDTSTKWFGAEVDSCVWRLLRT